MSFECKNVFSLKARVFDCMFWMTDLLWFCITSPSTLPWPNVLWFGGGETLDCRLSIPLSFTYFVFVPSDNWVHSLKLWLLQQLLLLFIFFFQYLKGQFSSVPRRTIDSDCPLDSAQSDSKSILSVHLYIYLSVEAFIQNQSITSLLIGRSVVADQHFQFLLVDSVFPPSFCVLLSPFSLQGNNNYTSHYIRQPVYSPTTSNHWQFIETFAACKCCFKCSLDAAHHNFNWQWESAPTERTLNQSIIISFCKLHFANCYTMRLSKSSYFHFIQHVNDDIWRDSLLIMYLLSLWHREIWRNKKWNCFSTQNVIEERDTQH